MNDGLQEIECRGEKFTDVSKDYRGKGNAVEQMTVGGRNLGRYHFLD
jgi:hypothetical protein